MKLVAAVAFGGTGLLVACSSSGGGSSSPPISDGRATSAPPVTSAASAGSSSYPEAGPVPSGPLGGNYCDPTKAYWSPSGTGIEVQVDGPAVSEVSISVVDAQNNDISAPGTGTGQIDAGKLGVLVHIPNVSVSKIAGVSLAIAGATQGICVVRRL
jgi:hypothetical protein